MSKRRARLMRVGSGAVVAALLGLFLLAAVAGAADPGVSARPATPPARPTEVTLPPGSVPPSQPATTTAKRTQNVNIFGTEVRVTLGVVVVAFAIAFFATRRRRAVARDERDAEERYEAGLYELDDLDELDDDEPADPDDPYGADDDEPVGV
jgi:hypothetical protein